jgi:hypothetical protein
MRQGDSVLKRTNKSLLLTATIAHAAASYGVGCGRRGWEAAPGLGGPGMTGSSEFEVDNEGAGTSKRRAADKG